jgi:ABC-2 type transport system ATP-binding protein
MSEAHALVVAEGLTKTFRTPLLRRRVEALRGVSFAVAPGSVTGFLGANGAGKTTTLKILLGLLAPTSGRAALFGEPVPSRRARARVGFMPETPSFPPNLTALEIVGFSARLQGTRDAEARAEDALRRANLEASAWRRPTSSLSKGQGQRVGLAAAIVSAPDLLILDEPMSGLDPIGRSEVRALIAEEHARGRTILFSTHVLSDAEELCTHVCMIDRGAVVVDGPLGALLADAGGRYGARFSDGARVEVDSEAALDEAVAAALARGAHVREVLPRRRRLQEVFDAHVTRGGA